MHLERLDCTQVNKYCTNVQERFHSVHHQSSRTKMKENIIFVNRKHMARRLFGTMGTIGQFQTISSARPYREIPRISTIKTILPMVFGTSQERKNNMDKVSIRYCFAL